MAEELLAKNQAKLETLKEKLIAKLKGELVDAETKWNEYVAQIKDKIVANLPSEEIFDDLISKIDGVLPEVEEKTGVSFSEIASKLGINAYTVSEALEIIAQDEALKNTVINTLKDKVSDLIAKELSDKQIVKDALNTIYGATEKDVVDAVLKLAEKDKTGITVKIILANIAMLVGLYLTTFIFKILIIFKSIFIITTYIAIQISAKLTSFFLYILFSIISP